MIKNHMKTKLLIISSFFLLPFVASASWWNPTSWFISENAPIAVNATTATITEPVIIPVETIEKTTTTNAVDDAETKARIRELKIENAALKLRLKNLEVSMDAVFKDVAALEARPIPSTFKLSDDSDLESMKSDLNKLNNDITEIHDKYSSFLFCLRNWSTGNEFMKADDVWHCANVHRL